jgi:uncharacterized protein (DUF1015 family)
MVTSRAMALVKPFRALRYDEGTAGPLDDLVSPPHDVVTPELEERLLAASPFNAVRLVHPDDPEEAGRALADWRRRGVLVREERPAVWIVEDSFAGSDGRPRTRRGIAARVLLRRYEDGLVLPHERTFPRQKDARLLLLRATRTKLSPVFLLHEGDAARPEGAPVLEAELEGVRSRLWRVSEPRAIDEVLAGIRGPLLVADGHHRYETALRFHEEEGTPETAYVLAVLVATRDPGLEILPTHRVTTGSLPELDGGLRLTELDGAEEALAALGALPRDRAAFVLVAAGRATLAEADAPGPDTAVVDSLPLEGVSFTASAAEAARAVSAGEATAAFLVRPPTVGEVEAVALSGGRMPPKSTYFHPKLTSGLLFAPFDE